MERRIRKLIAAWERLLDGAEYGEPFMTVDENGRQVVKVTAHVYVPARISKVYSFTCEAARP
jgi:hypothetical protein